MTVCVVTQDVIELSRRRLTVPTETSTWLATLPHMYEPMESTRRQRTRRK
jgi:hypothetical protein